MGKINNPHDTYLKEIFSHQDTYVPLIKAHLPSDVPVDWSVAEVTPDKIDFIQVGEDNETLVNVAADLMYKISENGNTNVLVTCHIELQSTVSEDMPVRVANYQTSYLNAYMKANKGKKLPIIVSFIYYTGDRPYTKETNMHKMTLNADVSQKYLANPILVDLGRIEDSVLLSYERIGTLELLLKYLRTDSAEEIFSNLVDDAKYLPDYIKLAICRYSIVCGDISYEKVLSEIDRLAINKRNKGEAHDWRRKIS